MTQNIYTGLVESSVESNNLQTYTTQETESNEIPWSGETCLIVSILFVLWLFWKLFGKGIVKVVGFILKLVFGVYLFRFLKHGGRI